MRNYRTNRQRNEQSGQALVELAISLSLLMLLVMGGAELAHMAHVALVVTNSAREGARAAAIGDDYAQVAQRVQASLGEWAKRSHTIEVTPVEWERRMGEPITVKVTVPVPLMTPVFSKVLTNPYPIQSSVVMRAE